MRVREVKSEFVIEWSLRTIHINCWLNFNILSCEISTVFLLMSFQCNWLELSASKWKKNGYFKIVSSHFAEEELKSNITSVFPSCSLHIFKCYSQCNTTTHMRQYYIPQHITRSFSHFADEMVSCILDLQWLYFTGFMILWYSFPLWYSEKWTGIYWMYHFSFHKSSPRGCFDINERHRCWLLKYYGDKWH